MEKGQLLERLHQLEREVDSLRFELEPGNERRNFFRNAQRLVGVIAEYWVFFSLLAAIATALYVKYNFNIDYFESYRNIATNRDLSKVYRDIGDKMMAISEWEAAEDAYRTALEVNPNNTDATYGIIKAQVFQPLEGEQFFRWEVADTKLEFLHEKFEEDYLVMFLQGTYYMSQGDDSNARVWLKKAIDQEDTFLGSYLNLGYIEQRSANFDEARMQFEKVLELDKDNALAHNNLGFLDLMELKFEDSVNHLEQASYLSPGSLVTAINLGDAYFFMGDLRNAQIWHEYALEVFNQPGIENERVISGQWLYNYMPRWEGDTCITKYSIPVDTLSRKLSILHYRLSFDYAFGKNFEAADQEFEEARSRDISHMYNIYFASRIDSIKNLLELDNDVLDWFETRQNILSPGYVPDPRCGEGS